jgi:hypothetical protein
MIIVIICSRRHHINPDNVATPIAGKPLIVVTQHHHLQNIDPSGTLT